MWYKWMLIAALVTVAYALGTRWNAPVELSAAAKAARPPLSSFVIRGPGEGM